MNKRAVIVVISCWPALACKPNLLGQTSAKSETNTPAFDSFLHNNDFVDNPATDIAESAAELAADLNTNNYFFNVSPYEQPKSDCISRTISALPVKAAKDGSILVDFTSPELASCMQADVKPSTGSTLTYNSFKFRMRLLFICKNTDLSKYNGMTMDQVAQQSANKKSICDGEGAALSECEMTQQTVRKTDSAVSNVSARTVIRQGLGDNAPCTVGNGAQPEVCEDIEATVVNQQPPPSSPTNTFKRYSNVKLVGGQTGTYFSSGSINFVINGWQGSMVYTNAATPPTWTAQHPQFGNASGTFTYNPNASLALTGDSQTSVTGQAQQLQDQLGRLLRVR